METALVVVLGAVAGYFIHKITLPGMKWPLLPEPEPLTLPAVDPLNDLMAERPMLGLLAKALLAKLDAMGQPLSAHVAEADALAHLYALLGHPQPVLPVPAKPPVEPVKV